MMKYLSLFICLLLLSCQKEETHLAPPEPGSAPSTDQMIMKWSGRYVGSHRDYENNDHLPERNYDTTFTDTFILSANSHKEWTLYSFRTQERYEAIPVDHRRTDYHEFNHISAGMRMHLELPDSLHYSRTWSERNLSYNGGGRFFKVKRIQ